MADHSGLRKTYGELMRTCGLSGCFWAFTAGLMERVAPDSGLYAACMRARHQTLLRYLKKELAPQLDKYRDAPAKLDAHNEGGIWVCWMQGEENAPPVVKRCIESLRRHAGGHPVTVVTRENLPQFTTIPQHLLDKAEKGIIAPKFFADLARTYLLRDHGGLWVDACIFLDAEIPKRYFDLPFFSVKMPDDGTERFVSQRRWTTGLIGGAAGCTVFRYAADCLTAYWEKHDTLLNTLMFDYILRLGADNVPAIGAMVDAVPENNTAMYSLGERGNAPFDPAEFAKLSADTVFFRFPWRKEYAEETPQGSVTWYGKIARGGETEGMDA